MAEKAITSDDYEIYILMMDMSRAFDTVDRKMLMNDLESILDEDELHMIKILLENVLLVVRCGDKLGKEFITDMGSPQGDCISPILFTLYMAKALSEKLVPLSDHNNYSPQTHRKLA